MKYTVVEFVPAKYIKPYFHFCVIFRDKQERRCRITEVFLNLLESAFYFTSMIPEKSEYGASIQPMVLYAGYTVLASSEANLQTSGLHTRSPSLGASQL